MSTGNNRNGKVLALNPKTIHTFKNKAEAMGFANMYGQVLQKRNELAQLESQFTTMCNELDIPEFIPEDNAHQIDFDALVLRHA